MRQARDQRSMDIMQEIDEVLLPKAVSIYNRILSDNNPESLGKEKLQKETADTIVMDIRGHRAPSKFQGEVAHAHASLKDLEEIKRRGIAAAKASGMCVDFDESAEVAEGEVVD
jgi:hypothetical protein